MHRWDGNESDATDAAQQIWHAGFQEGYRKAKRRAKLERQIMIERASVAVTILSAAVLVWWFFE